MFARHPPNSPSYLILIIAECPGPELNRHAIFTARDFKSLVSTSSTTRACKAKIRIIKNGLGLEIMQGVPAAALSPDGKGMPIKKSSGSVTAMQIPIRAIVLKMRTFIQ